MSTKALPGDPPWLKAAFSKLGLSEIQGSRHEKQVLEMYAACGHPEVKQDEVAWCAAFVGWCLRQAGLPNTGSLMARSYVKYGTKLPHGKIPRGAICIWPRGAPPSGHVNFCLHDDGETLTLIGGNQGNGKGGGVTITREAKHKLVEAVMPKRAAAPKPVPPPDIESPDEPPAQNVPWYKRLMTWITTMLAGGLTIGGVTLDAEFIRAAGWVAGAVFLAFIVWVYVFPPRGKFWKGVFK